MNRWLRFSLVSLLLGVVSFSIGFQGCPWLADKDDDDDIIVGSSGDTGTGDEDSGSSGESTFQPNVRVNENPPGPNGPSAWFANWGDDASLRAVAVMGNNVYVVWIDNRNNIGASQSPFKADIYFAKSTDSGATFGTNVRVDDDAGASAYYGPSTPSIAVDGSGNIYVAWTDERRGWVDIYFAKSTDGGVSFGTNIRVNDADIDAYFPSIAVDNDGSNIYVAWQESWRDDYNDDYNIYFAKSTDGGATFGTNVRVDDTGTSFSDQCYPSLAVDDSGNIYVAWQDERSNNEDIYFAKSTDGGATFGTNVRVNDVVYYTQRPSLAVDDSGSNIYVVWEDYRGGWYGHIYLAKSTDGGASFGASVRVDDSGTCDDQWNPFLDIDNSGNIYVVWHDDRNGNSDIYFAKSTDGGASFGTNVRVDDTGADTSYQWYPSIAVDGSNVYVVWEDERNGWCNIYLAKSPDGGASFGTNLRVNNSGISPTSIQYYPSPLVVDNSGNIYVAWPDNRNGNWDIYFAKSTDGGTSFGTNVQVNNDTGDQNYPCLAVDESGNIYIVWKSGNYTIYFAKSTDGGASFGTKVRVDDTADWVSLPFLTVDGSGNIYVTWSDKRNGNYDVYFDKSTDGGLSFGTDVRVDDTGADTNDQAGPRIALDKVGDIYIVWSDMRNGNYDAYLAKSTNGGTSFGTNVRVDDTGTATSAQYVSSIGVDSSSDHIYVVLQDNRNGGYEIYLAKSTNGGASFGTNFRVNDTNPGPGVGGASLGIDTQGNIYIAWQDYRNYSSRPDIYFAMSTDGGASFGTSVRVDDTGTARIHQYPPSLGVNTTGNITNIYIAWSDHRVARWDYDIYFSSSQVEITIQ